MYAGNCNLLISLSSESRSLVIAEGTLLPLLLKMSLYESEQIPPGAYFPTSGIASVATAMANGSTPEVGLLRSEGLIGNLYLPGSLTTSTRRFIQPGGD